MNSAASNPRPSSPLWALRRLLQAKGVGSPMVVALLSGDDGQLIERRPIRAQLSSLIRNKSDIGGRRSSAPDLDGPGRVSKRGNCWSGPLGGTHEEAPETGGARGFSGSLRGNSDGGELTHHQTPKRTSRFSVPGTPSFTIGSGLKLVPALVPTGED